MKSVVPADCQRQLADIPDRSGMRRESGELASMDIKIERNWLLLPVSNSDCESELSFWEGNVRLRSIKVKLGEVYDWMAAMDVSAWRGKTVRLQCDPSGLSEKVLVGITQSDNLPKDSAPCQEPYRPWFHFTPYRGWNNDPNGLVYYGGEYHMFFQHNPFGVNWGNMHWGHAVSRDLTHWEDLGDVLMPDELGAMFSGSAVVDADNTSGFGKDGVAPLVLIYTAFGEKASQCIAYSLDGRHFTKYDGNPVVPQQTGANRDPKVIWHEPTKRWIMAFYVPRVSGGITEHTVELWNSPNLRDWEKMSVIHGGKDDDRFLYECPELFEMTIEGTTETRWVIFGGNNQYQIGSFDGREFVPESEPLSGHSGISVYAAQTFNNEPEGRRILVHWTRAQTPEKAVFNQGMSIPQELRLIRTDAGLRLAHYPVWPTTKAPVVVLDASAVSSGSAMALPESRAFCVELGAILSSDAVISLDLRGVKVAFDMASQRLVVDGRELPWSVQPSAFGVRIFVDQTLLEVFSADGLNYAAVACQPKDTVTASAVVVSRGTASDVRAMFHDIGSIWKMNQ